MSNIPSLDTSISDSVYEDSVDSVLFGADSETPDVVEPDTVADPPAAPSEPIVEPDAADEPEAEPAEDEPEAELAPEPEATDVQDLPDFKDAPEAWKNLRDKYATTRKENLDLKSNSIQDKFLTDTDGFLNDLSGLSKSQFQQTTQQIVKRGIDDAPEIFANYIASVSPDAVAKAVAGLSPDVLAEQLFGKGTTAANAQKIVAQVKAQDLESYLDDGQETPYVAPAQPTKPDDKQSLSREEIDQLVEQRVKEAGRPQAVEALEQRTYGEIMKPVEALLKEYGLTDDAVGTPEQQEANKWVRERVIKDTFEHLMDDEKNAPRSKKMLEFISNLDEAGVKNLSSTAAIIAEDYAGKQIEMLTKQLAVGKTKPTIAKASPPKKVPASASVPQFGNASAAAFGNIADISESDFEKAGM